MYSFIPALSCFVFTASELQRREGGLGLPFKLIINCLQFKKKEKRSPLKCFHLKMDLNVLKKSPDWLILGCAWPRGTFLAEACGEAVEQWVPTRAHRRGVMAPGAVVQQPGSVPPRGRGRPWHCPVLKPQPQPPPSTAPQLVYKRLFFLVYASPFVLQMKRCLCAKERGSSVLKNRGEGRAGKLVPLEPVSARG